MPQLKIQYRDPILLSIHPALKQIPALGEEDLKPIRAGLKYGGETIAPILVSEEGQILSDTSRTAWLCAKARQLKEVPVCICAAADVHLIIVRDLAHRRHLSKSAIAYLAIPHLQPALDAARLKALENLRKGQEIPVSHSVGDGAETIEELAEELGIGRELLRMAVLVRKAFEDDKKEHTWNLKGAHDGATAQMTYKQWFEPQLLRSFTGGEHENYRPIGLGGILAGISGKKKDPNDFNPKLRQQDFFSDLFTRDVQKFIALPELKRAKAIAVITKAAEEMEPAECEEAAATLKVMAKIYSDAAKAKA